MFTFATAAKASITESRVLYINLDKHYQAFTRNVVDICIRILLTLRTNQLSLSSLVILDFVQPLVISNLNCTKFSSLRICTWSCDQVSSNLTRVTKDQHFWPFVRWSVFNLVVFVFVYVGEWDATLHVAQWNTVEVMSRNAGHPIMKITIIIKLALRQLFLFPNQLIFTITQIYLNMIVEYTLEFKSQRTVKPN